MIILMFWSAIVLLFLGMFLLLLSNRLSGAYVSLLIIVAKLSAWALLGLICYGVFLAVTEAPKATPPVTTPPVTQALPNADAADGPSAVSEVRSDAIQGVSPSASQQGVSGDAYVCAHGDPQDNFTIEACDRKDLASDRPSVRP